MYKCICTLNHVLTANVMEYVYIEVMVKLNDYTLSTMHSTGHVNCSQLYQYYMHTYT